MSSQPVWITTAGSLGVVAENQFNQWNLSATESDGSTLFYKVIAGSVPTGVYLDPLTGILAGIPSTEVATGADVLISGVDVTSKFVVRSYTTTNNQVNGTVNRLADRTFTITVAGQSAPEWITPAGQIGQFYDGSLLSPGFQLQYIDENILSGVTPVSLVAGSLPPGLTLSDTGLISGFIQPNASISALAGFSRDDQGYAQYPFDFNTKSQNYNYEFTLKVTDGRTSALRTFSMYIFSTSTFNASTTDITSDNTYLNASISSADAPIILNPQGSIGAYRNDNFFAYQFTGYDINNSALGFVGHNLPSGLQLNSDTGWLYGYIPNLGLTELTYNFTVRTYVTADPTIISDPYHYSITFIGAISASVTWTTPSYLGSINNGDTSLFYVQATTTSNLALQYRLVSGSNSKLPEGLTLLPTGEIVGRVSFNLFALDNGATAVDSGATTFDSTYTFNVNVYSNNGYISVNQTFSINVLDTFKVPYNNLYIQCMPPESDRELISGLLENTTIFPSNLLFRPNDANFGVAKKVIYNHAYGLTATTLETYVTALQLNHYWKKLTLGQIETAQALDDKGQVIYEVVYSKIIDNLVNNNNESADKQIVLPYPIDANTPDQINDVYPNALADMRQQVIDVVGQENNMLPRWMLSKQSSGNVLGFTPAWVIAYTQPGKSSQIAYNIYQQYGVQLNKVDFEADRYELDCALTTNWDPYTNSWTPNPPTMTTFDIEYHYNCAISDAGVGYRAGDMITIAGARLGGASPTNNLVLTVNIVDDNGAIVSVFCNGFAGLFAAGTSYANLSGTGGRGVGAKFSITVVGGAQTVLDHNSLQFVVPSDIDTGTQARDRYLLYPKRDILGGVESVGPQGVLWTNTGANAVSWTNNSNTRIVWVDANP